MRPMTEKESQEFLAGPHVAVLSIARGDDRPPHTTPVWYAYEPGGNVTFFTGTQGRRSRKAELVEGAGAVSLTVQREEFPYRYVTVEGTVLGLGEIPDNRRVRARVVHDPARPLVDLRLRRRGGVGAKSRDEGEKGWRTETP